jgi:hypothetical protein
MHPCRDKNQHNTSMRNFQYYIVVIWPYMESCQIHECENQWSTSIIIEKTNHKKVTYDVFRIPCLNEIFYKNRQGILLIIGCFDPLKQVGLFRLGGPNETYPTFTLWWHVVHGLAIRFLFLGQYQQCSSFNDKSIMNQWEKNLKCESIEISNDYTNNNHFLFPFVLFCFVFFFLSVDSNRWVCEPNLQPGTQAIRICCQDMLN